MPSKCCVPLCRFHQTPLHKFPADEQLMKIWCTKIGRKDLLQRNFNAIRKSYRVCDIHFSESEKFPSFHNRTNLKVRSVPNLHLPLSTEVELPTALMHSEVMDMELDVPIDLQMEFSLPSSSATDVHTPPQGISDESSMQLQDIPETSNIKKRTTSVRTNILRKRRNILLEVNLRKKSQLSPKALKLYKIANEYKKIAHKLNYTVSSNKERIKSAIKHAESGMFFQNKVNTYTYKFIMSQISQQKKAPRGRRFSREDKILSLTLLKQSPKSYKLLRKIFALPSRKTLMSLLAKIPFDCGINKPIFESLKRNLQNVNPRDRHCILLFDEISLQPLLHYKKTKQTIDGFQSTSEGNVVKIADHAMVFMIKGLAKKWKQPIAYYFSQNGLANAEVAKNIKEIIHYLLEIGIQVVATVCDQYNKAAINMLVAETKRNCIREGRSHEIYSFTINDKEIFPLFDFPHLLKGIRNNMLKYDVRFTWRNGIEVASWSHLEQLYNIDSFENDDFRLLNKITAEHIVKNQIRKMKVKHAAQVFSHRVQSTMRALVKHGREGLMPKEAIGTANFLLFVDKLFDSVNSSSINPQDGKILRRAVSKTTEHITFWREAIRVLQSIKFFGNRKEFVPPTIANWVLSLKNLILLWKKLQISGFEFLLTRNLNQDPLENFFSCIRSHGVRNVNPSCTSFTNAFKTLIVNNFMATHSIYANCEEDECQGALDSFGDFLDTDSHEEATTVPLNYGQERLISLKSCSDSIVMNLHGYLAGYMSKNILKSIGACTTCKHELLTQHDSDEHQLIQIRELKPNTLLRPRTKFIVLFNLCVQIVHYWLPRICNENNLLSKLFLIVDANINKSIFSSCDSHNLHKIFVNMFINFYCYTWVHNVNKILKGLQIQNINDNIKRQALQLHLKNKSKCNRLRLEKHLQS